MSCFILCPQTSTSVQHALLTGYEGNGHLFWLSKPSSVSHLDLYPTCSFKSWLKISNFNYNDFSHSALCVITRTRLWVSVFICWTHKDISAFTLNRRIALHTKEGEKIYFYLAICFTLTFNQYINISSFSVLQTISNSSFFLAITILNCQGKLECLFPAKWDYAKRNHGILGVNNICHWHLAYTICKTEQFALVFLQYVPECISYGLKENWNSSGMIGAP